MFSKAEATLFPICALALVGFFYSRRVQMDLTEANKKAVYIVFPVFISISLSAQSFDPNSALSFTREPIALVLLSGLIAWLLVKFSKVSDQAFSPAPLLPTLILTATH